MKIFLSVSLYIFAVQICIAQELSPNEYEIKTNLKDFSLNGKIQKLVSTAKDVNGHFITLPFLENEYYNQFQLEFNQRGQLTKRTNYLDYNGKIGTYSFVDYTYNTSYLLTTQKTTIVNNGEDPLRVSSLKEYGYNNKGNISVLNEIVKGKSSASSYQTDFIYSHRLENITTKVDGTIFSKNQFWYNKKGQIIKIENISFDGKKGLTKYYIYDDKTPIYTEENINNRRNITFINIDTGTKKFQQFDQNQNLKLELVYNNQKNVIEAKAQSFIGGKSILKTYTFSYEFDNYKNWTTCKVVENEKPVYIITRNITYYNN